ncbi:MAG: hypothetical protein KIS61_21275 [Candidatus Eremiobacteraeota bacterium]|nr:hypothetical protein [Candidatus Eremiobacteraeota bacterium]
MAADNENFLVLNGQKIAVKHHDTDFSVLAETSTRLGVLKALASSEGLQATRTSPSQFCLGEDGKVVGEYRQSGRASTPPFPGGWTQESTSAAL